MTLLIQRLAEVIDAELVAQGAGLEGIEAERIAEAALDYLWGAMIDAGWVQSSQWLADGMAKPKPDKVQLGINYDV